jgi:hypothetical protein
MGHCIYSYFFRVVSFPQDFNKDFIRIFFTSHDCCIGRQNFPSGFDQKLLTHDRNVKRRQSVIEVYVFLVCACLASKGKWGPPLGVIYILPTISEDAVY